MRLIEISQDECLRQIGKYQMLRRRGVADEHDFGLGVLNSIVYAKQDAWEECIRRLSMSELGLLNCFLDEEVRPLDFMPFPRSFMVDFSNEEAIEEKKLELRPRYLAISEMISEAKKKRNS